MNKPRLQFVTSSGAWLPVEPLETAVSLFLILGLSRMADWEQEFRAAQEKAPAQVSVVLRRMAEDADLLDAVLRLLTFGASPLTFVSRYRACALHAGMPDLHRETK